MNILISGGSGFIGKRLSKALVDAGHTLTILTRSAGRENQRNISYLQWNAKEMPLGMGIYDVVINLAGASIAEAKWTESYKALIQSSRIETTRACVNYINRASRPPKVFISASAVGYYGGMPSGINTEDSPAGKDFLGKTCYAWEAEALKSKVRTVLPRLGVVLGDEGGAFPLMELAYSFFLGGVLASGRQGFPWVHVDDVVQGIIFAIEDPEVSGPLNFVGPEIVDQRHFSNVLSQVMNKPAPFVVPKFMLELMFGERAVLFWGGQKASAQRLIDHGYQFKYPGLKEALSEVV